MLMMALVFTFVGVATRQYEAVAIGVLLALGASAVMGLSSGIYLDADKWMYQKRICVWGLPLRHVDRALALYDREGRCTVQFDRQSKQRSGYRLGLLAEDHSVIWIDFMGYRNEFKEARKKCNEAWKSRVDSLGD